MASRFLIYGLVDPRTEQVRYIGKSCSGLTRPRNHALPSVLRQHDTHERNWVRSLRKAGLSFKITVLEEVSTGEHLGEIERFWIAQGRGLGWRLTNLTKGGDGTLGYRHTEATKARLRAQSDGRVASAETRAKISAASAGRRISADARERIAASKRGKPRSEGTRLKLREANLGKTYPEAYRLKMAIACGSEPFEHVASGRRFVSRSEAARVFGVTPQAISQAIRRGLSFRSLV